MQLTSTDFLKYWGQYNVKTSLTFFDQKILIGDLYTRNPHTATEKKLFHIGDLFYFGAKKDLLDLFDIQLVTREVVEYFKTHPKYDPLNDIFYCKLFPEQYIWLTFINKYHPIDLKHPFHSTKVLIKLHDAVMVSNCILIELEKNGLQCLKYPNAAIQENDLYSHEDYKFLYYFICEKKIELDLALMFWYKKYLSIIYKKIREIEHNIRHFFKKRN